MIRMWVIKAIFMRSQTKMRNIIGNQNQGPTCPKVAKNLITLGHC